MDKILEEILNAYRIPQELLMTENSNLSSIKIQQEQFENKLKDKLNKVK